jgi:hypothetical protein
MMIMHGQLEKVEMAITYFKLLSWHSPGTMDNSGQPTFQLKTEPGKSQI